MTHTVLITGAGGYIGSVAARMFLTRGYRVVALDNFSTGYREPLKFLQHEFGHDRLRVVEADLTGDISEVFSERENISAVLHFAASCSVDESMKDPQKYFANNVVGSHTLLTAMIEHNVDTIIFSSTCAVYGEAEYVPVDEKHPTVPANPYGASKLMTEQMIRWYGDIGKLRYVVLRYFNVCGASYDGAIGDSKKPSSLLVQNAVRGALGIAPFYLTCPVVNTPDKTPIRDYVNVEDLCEAHLKALIYLTNKGVSTTLNLGTGKGNSVREIIDAVQKITGKSFRTRRTQARKGEYPAMIASIKEATKILGWKPTRTIEESVSSLVSWYQKHPKGWNE